MKDLLCKAFCSSLDVKTVPIGYAVRTPYSNSDGDPLLLYFVRDGHQHWRIEDDGTQVALLEANGVDVRGKARGSAFHTLLEEYGAHFEKEERTLQTPALSEEELGAAAVRFVGLLLRLQDLALLSPQVVRSTFREDALAAMHLAFDQVAKVEEGAPLSPDLVGYEADAIIRPRIVKGPPIAVYLATSEERALLALVAKMEAESYRHVEGKVVLMVETAKSNPIKESTYSLSLARLDSVVSFHARQDAIQRLTTLAGFPPGSVTLQ